MLVGCVAIGAVFAYVALTDPAAEMLALRAASVATATPKLEPTVAVADATPTVAPTSTPAPFDTVAGVTALVDTVVANAQNGAGSTDVLQGNVNWSAANGPVVVQRNILVPAGSRLTVEPGTEVRVGQGVAIVVAGELRVVGRPQALARLLPAADGRDQQWQGVFGTAGSVMTLAYAEIQGAGVGGTLLASLGDALHPGSLTVRNALVSNNSGQVLVVDSYLDLRDSTISDNTPPAGALINATYAASNDVILIGNQLVENHTGRDVPSISIASTNDAATLTMQLQRNLVVTSSDAANLMVSLHGPLRGRMSCNTLRGGNVGLAIHDATGRLTGMELAVYNNAIEQHLSTTVYGATSEVELRMYGNWWGDGSGPYHPLTNPNGRGDAVSDHIEYSGWLTGPPDCAPTP